MEKIYVILGQGEKNHSLIHQQFIQNERQNDPKNRTFEQAKLGFREWMITIVKKMQVMQIQAQSKTVEFYVTQEKNYYNPMTQFLNIYYQKTSKIAILSPFL